MNQPCTRSSRSSTCSPTRHANARSRRWATRCRSSPNTSTLTTWRASLMACVPGPTPARVGARHTHRGHGAHPGAQVPQRPVGRTGGVPTARSHELPTLCLLSDSANVPIATPSGTTSSAWASMARRRCFRPQTRSCCAMATSPAAGRSSTPPWYPRPSSTSPSRRRRCSMRARCPATGAPAKRRQRIWTPRTQKHGKSYHGYKLSIGVDVRHKFIRKITTGTASEARQHAL